MGSHPEPLSPVSAGPGLICGLWRQSGSAWSSRRRTAERCRRKRGTWSSGWSASSGTSRAPCSPPCSTCLSPAWATWWDSLCWLPVWIKSFLVLRISHFCCISCLALSKPLCYPPRTWSFWGSSSPAFKYIILDCWVGVDPHEGTFTERQNHLFTFELMLPICFILVYFFWFCSQLKSSFLSYHGLWTVSNMATDCLTPNDSCSVTVGYFCGVASW